jgi:hypothetical protein
VILEDGGSPRFVRVSVKGSEIFTAPQETGEFILSNLPTWKHRDCFRTDRL